MKISKNNSYTVHYLFRPMFVKIKKSYDVIAARAFSMDEDCGTVILDELLEPFTTLTVDPGYHIIALCETHSFYGKRALSWTSMKYAVDRSGRSDEKHPWYEAVKTDMSDASLMELSCICFLLEMFPYKLDYLPFVNVDITGAKHWFTDEPYDTLDPVIIRSSDCITVTLTRNIGPVEMCDIYLCRQDYIIKQCGLPDRLQIETGDYRQVAVNDACRALNDDYEEYERYLNYLSLDTEYSGPAVYCAADVDMETESERVDTLHYPETTEWPLPHSDIEIECHLSRRHLMHKYAVRICGDRYEHRSSAAVDHLIGSMIDSLYYLLFVLDEDMMQENIYPDKQYGTITNDHGHIKGLTAFFNWDSEGDILTWYLCSELSEDPDRTVRITLKQLDGGSRDYTVSLRDLCYAAAKAVTGLLRETGISGYFSSSGCFDINIHRFLCVKAYAVYGHQMDLDKDPRTGKMVSKLDREIELLLLEI